MTSNYQLQGQDAFLLPDDDKPILAYVPLWKCDFFSILDSAYAILVYLQECTFMSKDSPRKYFSSIESL